MVKKETSNNKHQTLKLKAKFKKTTFALAVFVCAFICSFAFAQGAEFTASVDKDKVAMDDTLELTLTVIGSQNAQAPELPAMDGLEVMSTGTSSQYSFINGQTSVRKNFTYVLMPTKEGSATIPSVSMEIDGKTLQTKPITVEVVKAGQSQPVAQGQKRYQPEQEEPVGSQVSLKDRLFIEVTTDKDTAYIGEQVSLKFKLYRYGVMVDNLQYNPPGTKCFIAEPMGNQREYRETKNGIVYDVIELDTALFPATAGEVTIDPAQLKCDLLLKEQSSRRRSTDPFFDDFFGDSFFANYVRKPILLESEPIKITVLPLPADGKPSGFAGAVGVYEFSADASPLSLKAGEPINIVMKITGTGNISQVSEPVINNLEGFRGYDAEVKTNITERYPTISGTKEFRKMIIPQSENIKEIPAINFPYFDTNTKQYRVISKGPFSISVAPNPNKGTEILEFKKAAEEKTEDEGKKTVSLIAKNIQYIKTLPGNYITTGKLWYSRRWLWLVVIVLPLCVLGVSFVRKVHMVKMETDTAYAKSRGAGKISRHLLSEAIIFEKENKHKEFYDSIAKALQKFISDKLNIPAGAVTSSEIENILTPKKVNITTINSIKNLFNTCDLMRFGAHASDKEEMKQVVKEVNVILNILGKHL